MKLGSVWFLSTLRVLPTGDGNSKKKHQETNLKKRHCYGYSQQQLLFLSPFTTLHLAYICRLFLVKIVLIDT